MQKAQLLLLSFDLWGVTFTPYVVSVTLGSDPDGLCLLILFVW